MAERIFGKEDPIGKQLACTEKTIPYTVAGIFRDIPENSHFTFLTLSLLSLI